MSPEREHAAKPARDVGCARRACLGFGRDRRRAAERGASRAGIFGGLLLAAVLGYVVLQTIALEAATCEVCMEYRGRSQCRTVGGASVEEARTAAITNACAYLASGITEGMACQRMTPVSESCR